jgi:hypothetical protein
MLPLTLFLQPPLHPDMSHDRHLFIISLLSSTPPPRYLRPFKILDCLPSSPPLHPIAIPSRSLQSSPFGPHHHVLFEFLTPHSPSHGLLRKYLFGPVTHLPFPIAATQNVLSPPTSSLLLFHSTHCALCCIEVLSGTCFLRHTAPYPPRHESFAVLILVSH